MNWKMFQIVDEFDSKFSGKLLIKQIYPWKKEYCISTDRVTQSGSIVKELWEPVIKKYGKKNKNWLLLGVAGGTVLQLISKHKSPSSLTGVEIDPVMIEVGKKYFGLNTISKLTLVTQDAQKFVTGTSDSYDYVLVDMYYRDQLPSFVYDAKFVDALRKIGKTVIFNHLYYLPEHYESVKQFVDQLSTKFTNVRLQRQNLNIFIICE